MSYILDALKKADQERAAGDVPDLEAVHTVSHEEQRGFPRWILIVVVLLIVNGVLLAVLFSGKDAGSPQQPAEVIVKQPVSPLPPVAVAPAPVVPVPQAVIEKPVAPAPVAPAPVVLPPVKTIQPVAKTERPAVEFSDVPLTPVVTPRPAPPAVITPVTEPVPAPAPAPVQITPVPQPPAIIAKPVVMPQPVEEQQPGRRDSGIPYWGELPLAYRASFELPRLDVHVYSETPARRFILVNLRKYREGDELPNDIDLDEILPDGLLLRYNGRQFRMHK